MLRTAGLAARPAKGVKPTSLLAPTGLTADGFSDGTLLLKWTRTNRVRTGFVVETSADGAVWEYVGTTMRTSFRAPGAGLRAGAGGLRAGDGGELRPRLGPVERRVGLRADSPRVRTEGGVASLRG